MNNDIDKEIMAKNLQRLMDLTGKSRQDVCDALGFKYSTLSEWLQARKYPRPDKIKKLAAYFKVTRSDLVDPPASSNVNINGDNNSINGTINTGTIGNVTTIDGNVTINHQGTVSEVHRMYQSLPEEARKRIDRMVKGEYEDAMARMKKEG